MVGKAWTKVVVRGLPPAFGEEDFLQKIEEAGVRERLSWWRFVQGRGERKPKGYLAFDDGSAVQDAASFLDGMPFVSQKGSRYVASVEYAPNQEVPKGRQQADPKEGTLNDDDDFKSFVERVQLERESSIPSAEAQLDQREESNSGAEKRSQTPLMEHVEHLRKSNKNHKPGVIPSLPKRGRGKATLGINELARKQQHSQNSKEPASQTHHSKEKHKRGSEPSAKGSSASPSPKQPPRKRNQERNNMKSGQAEIICIGPSSQESDAVTSKSKGGGKQRQSMHANSHNNKEQQSPRKSDSQRAKGKEQSTVQSDGSSQSAQQDADRESGEGVALRRGRGGRAGMPRGGGRGEGRRGGKQQWVAKS